MINVAVGLIIKESPRAGAREVLLCQRKSDARYALKWEFPGGKLEPGEHPDDCLRRARSHQSLGFDTACSASPGFSASIGG